MEYLEGEFAASLRQTNCARRNKAALARLAPATPTSLCPKISGSKDTCSLRVVFCALPWMCAGNSARSTTSAALPNWQCQFVAVAAAASAIAATGWRQPRAAGKQQRERERLRRARLAASLTNGLVAKRARPDRRASEARRHAVAWLCACVRVSSAAFCELLHSAIGD